MIVSPRYTHEQQEPKPGGLLKYRITAPQGQVYVHCNKGIVAYKIMKNASYVMHKTDTEIESSVIDTPFCELFFAHLRGTHDFDDYRQWLTAEVEKRQQETATLTQQLTTLATLEEAIQDDILSIRMEIKAKKITEEQAAPQISRLRARLVKLDTSRTELEAKLQTNTTDTTLEKTAKTLRAFGTFQEELEHLIATWDKKPFALRQDFVNLFVEKAVIEVVATHWMQLAIT